MRAYVAAAGLGLLVYLIVFGPAHLVGGGPYWEMPTPDERMYLIGYRYFVHEPWHWPLLASTTIDVPFRPSVAYWDVIPLWALVNKALATIIPPWEGFTAHAYLGLWHALTYALQACLGVACLRALGHRSWFATITGALFLLAVPAWIYRGWHDALSAHWIELWALSLYLRGRIGWAWLAQLAVGAMVTPYHPVMSLGIFAAALARTRTPRTIAIWAAAGLATVALATWLAGYFDPAGTGPQWGFEEESANLLSWLVPVRSGILGNADWLATVMATPWQYEGYAYLGLGYLGLLGWVAPQLAVVRRAARRHAALLAVAIAFAVLALSNHIYFGSHQLASFRIPRFLHWLPDHFRSPGRFVWVAMYVAILFVLHRALLRFRWVLVVLLAVQLADARGDWAEFHTAVHGPQWWRVLDLDATRAQLAPYTAVDIEPSYTCITGPDLDRLSEVSLEIAMLASERALPINGTYNARLVRDCAAEQQAWATLVPVPGTLYVVLPQADALAARFTVCEPFSYGRMCAVR